MESETEVLIDNTQPVSLIENVVMLSDFKSGQFGKDYGLEITDGPLSGLSSRSIVIVNSEGKVTYTEQVTETVNEPNYEAALASL